MAKLELTQTVVDAIPVPAPSTMRSPNGSGIWAGQFVVPWEWRRGERLQAEAANDHAPAACLIKGNDSKSGRGKSKGL